MEKRQPSPEVTAASRTWKSGPAPRAAELPHMGRNDLQRPARGAEGNLGPLSKHLHSRAFPSLSLLLPAPWASRQLQRCCREPGVSPYLGYRRMPGTSLLQAAFSSLPHVPRLSESHLPGTGKAICSWLSTSHLKFQGCLCGSLPLPPFLWEGGAKAEGCPCHGTP